MKLFAESVNEKINALASTRDFYVDDFVVEEITTTGFLADIRQATDYSPFGVPLDGRTLTLTGANSDYRYSFQNQEHDDEIKGEGNSINFEFRMHDPRLGRFFAIDPLTKNYPHYTPYSYSGNKVIHCKELEGKEEIIATLSSDYQTWILTWDVTARTREGEKGKILYQTNDGQVLEKMREVNDLEMNHPFISSRINMESNDPRIEQPNREPERAGGTSATCVNISGSQICDMSVPREFANPIPCPTPPPLVDAVDTKVNNNSSNSKKEMSDKVKKELLNKLKAGSVFGPTVSGGGVSTTWDVNKGAGITGSIQDIMSKYKEYDLSNLKIEFNFTLGSSISAGNGKTNFYKDGSAFNAKDKMLEKIINEFVASGLKRENISGKAYTSKSRGNGDIKVTINVK